MDELAVQFGVLCLGKGAIHPQWLGFLISRHSNQENLLKAFQRAASLGILGSVDS